MTEKNFIFQAKKFAKKSLANYLKIDQNIIEDSEGQESRLQVNNEKYDVKVSSPVSIAAAKKGLVWDFDIRDNSWKNGRNIKARNDSPDCDFYLLVGLIKEQPKKTFLLGAKDAPSSHIRISVTGESKYYQYAI